MRISRRYPSSLIRSAALDEAGWFLLRPCLVCRLAVLEMCSPASATHRLCYTSSQLLSLRQHCVGIPRKTRRRVFSLGIRNREHVCSRHQNIPVRVTSRKLQVSESRHRQRVPIEFLQVPIECQNVYVRHIPVRISSRIQHCHTFDSSDVIRERYLVPVPRVITLRKPRRRAALPSLLLSNVRSVVNKLDEVSELFLRVQPDISVLTESWLDESIPDSSLHIDNYTVFRRDRVDRKGGGIVIYIRSVFSCSIVDSSDIPGLPSSRSETLVIFIRDFNLLLVGVYHPFWNDVAAHEEALSCLTGILDFAHVTFGPNLRIIVCGDLNDLRFHLTTLSSLTQLVPVVNFSTRGSSCLDQILTNFATETRPTYASPIGRSDHVVVLWRPSPAVNLPVRKLKVRKLSRSNLPRFRHAISSIDWLSLVEASAELDDAASILLECLFHLFDSFFPLRTIRVRASEPKWMKASLKVSLLIDDRDRAFHKHQMAKYYRLREEVISHIRHLKSSFITACASSDSPATLWKSLRSLGGLRKPRPSSARFSADQFCEYFASNFQSASDLSSFISYECAVSPPVLSPFEVYECVPECIRSVPPRIHTFVVFQTNLVDLTVSLPGFCVILLLFCLQPLRTCLTEVLPRAASQHVSNKPTLFPSPSAQIQSLSRTLDPFLYFLCCLKFWRKSL